MDSRMNDKLAAGYIRVSTQEQSQKGLSLETQSAEIEEYCKRKGLRLYRIYVDKGITARKHLAKRASFMEMMRDVQAGKIGHIVVLRLDRFFRNVYDYHRMMEEFLIPNGCEWSAVREEYTTATTNGRLMINLRLAIAEQECDQDSDRIKDVFAHRVAEGYVIGGTLPYGYSAVDKRLVQNEDAPVVKDIFETFCRTSSVRRTMNEINSKYGLNLTYWIVRGVLSKRIYTGEYRGNSGYCDPIVTRERFFSAQTALAKNIRVRANHRIYLFSGIIRCAECGKIMAGVSSCDKYDLHYYRCPNAYLNSTCKNTKSVSQNKIERYLLENVEELLRGYVLKASVSEEKRRSAPARKGNRKQIETKMNRLNELFVNGLIDMDELKRKREELEAQIVEEIPPKEVDLTAVNQFLEGGFLRVYNTFSEAHKQDLWRSVIREIRSGKTGLEEVLFL